MDNVEVAQDTITTMAPVEEVVTEPVVETPVPEVVTHEPEKSTMERLDEIVAKVQAKGKEAAAGKTKEGAVVATPPGTAAAYTPNFKVSIFQGKDKPEKEFEIPKEFQGLIKDKKSEAMVKDLFTKAEGLDSVKSQRDEIKKNYEQASTQIGQMNASIADMRKTFQSGDIDGFLEKLKIPEEKMMLWAVNKAKYYELPPEQRAALDERRNSQKRVETLDTTAQTLAQTNAQANSRLKAMEMDIALTKPDYSAAIKDFDSKLAKPGAFRELAWNHGAMTWASSGGKIDLTPEEAIKAVMEKYGIKPGADGEVVATTATPPATPGGMAALPKKPVTTIPNIKGGQTSPVGKPKPRRAEDLKKMYQEKYG